MTVTREGSERVEREPVDLDDPRLSRFDIVREGARRDEIEIVHYEAQYPVGSKAERRGERLVALFFLLTGLASLTFLAVYIWWPWRYEVEPTVQRLYTPLLGLTMGVALLGIGFAILTWGKKLLPRELSVQARHEAMDTDEDRKITGQTMVYMVEELGVQRRPLLKGALALGLLPVGAVAVAPLIGGLIKDPHTDEKFLYTTGFNPKFNNGQPVRLTREDGTPIRPEDVSVGGQMTVFPGIPEGATNKFADSPTLLIHLRADDAVLARQNNAGTINEGSMWGNYIAYSKVCTHAGCPPSLYEQQTNRLLCPCHQSQFMITDNARPIFGPASRPLPQLPLTLDPEGFFVAVSDYREPVGPDFWERP